MKKVLVTGAVGFVGFYLTERLLSDGYNVVGVDNLNSYYDIKLKQIRLQKLTEFENFEFIKENITNHDEVVDIFRKNNFFIVFHLAAQAGVRYSIENPKEYIDSNINGFFSILEACRRFPVDHLLYASSSSVYGNNSKVPYRESDFVDNPVSLYAATKKSNELMAYTYSHLYGIPCSGLRFFTVYGPLGRPDMAYYSFANKLINNEVISIYNNGDFKNDLFRDFTYIDDIVESMIRLINIPPTSNPKYDVINIGNNSPVSLMDFISTLEKSLSKSLGRMIEFKKKFEPIKPGDVKITYASNDKLFEKTNYRPRTSLSEGLQKFSDWFIEYKELN